MSPLTPYRWPYLWVGLAVVGGLAVLAALPVADPEPLLLRWLRCCSDHPVRAAVAVALAGHALRRGRPRA